MRILSKFVAAVVAVALSATPLLAAIPCPGSMAPAAHCAPCCAMMAAAMPDGMESMDMAAPSDAAAAQDPARLEQPPCCAASSAETSAPAILRQVQGPLTNSVAVSSGSALLDLLPALPQHRTRPSPDCTGRSRVYSLLCTFRI